MVRIFDVLVRVYAVSYQQMGLYHTLLLLG